MSVVALDCVTKHSAEMLDRFEDGERKERSETIAVLDDICSQRCQSYRVK